MMCWVDPGFEKSKRLLPNAFIIELFKHWEGVNPPYIEVFMQYGIHNDEHDVRWIVQNLGAANFVGLSKDDVPVDLPKTRNCPHNIPYHNIIVDKKHWHNFKKWLKDDKLVRLMVPEVRPDNEDCFWVPYQNGIEKHLNNLIRLTSPIERVIHPIWNTTLPMVRKQLGLTNLQPLVITGVGVGDIKKVRQISELAALENRRVIFVGAKGMQITPPGLKPVKTNASRWEVQMTYPWENFGCLYLKKYCQNMDLHDILESGV